VDSFGGFVEKSDRSVEKWSDRVFDFGIEGKAIAFWEMGF
jgi:hypothetical protein